MRYSSERDGAYNLAASQPIHTFKVTIEINALTQAWCQDKIKQKVLTYIEKSHKVCVRKKHSGLARWEMEECCKDKGQPECQLRGRKILLNRKSDWDTGNVDGVMAGSGLFMDLGL